MELDLHKQAVRELDKEIANRQTELDELRRVRDYHARKLQSIAEPALAPQSHASFEKMSQADAAWAILEKNGEPMHTNLILRELRSGGYEFRTADEGIAKNSVYSAMVRDERFVLSGRSTWALRQWIDGEGNATVKQTSNDRATRMDPT